MELGLFFALALLAEIIGTMAGFGASTILLPIALYFFEFKTALTLVAFLHISGDLGRMIFFRKHFNKKLILLFGIPSVIFALLGSLLVSYISADALESSLGAFLILFAVFSLMNKDFKIKQNTRTSVLGGALSGFFAGIIGIGGAIKSTFLTSFNLKKSVYIATLASIAIMTDLTRISVYAFQGFISPQQYLYVPVLFALGILGSFLGKKIVDRIPQHSFRKFVLLAIAIVGIKLFLDGIL